MAVLNLFYHWTFEVLFWGLLALRVWAAIDCAVRKAPAFPAADKRTKPIWMAITLACALVPALPVPAFSAPLGLISLAAIIGASIYLADVRPAVREISGGH